MKSFKLIRSNAGFVSILTDEEVHPTQEWLAVQRKKPKVTGRWFTAYPLTGGSINVQEGAFEVLCDATDEHFNEAMFGHGYNPAAESIHQLRQEGPLTLHQKLKKAMKHFNYDVYYDDVIDDLHHHYGSKADDMTVQQIVEYIRNNDYAITGML